MATGSNRIDAPILKHGMRCPATSLYTCRSEIFSNCAISTTRRARLFCSKESARPTLSELPGLDPNRSGSCPESSWSRVPPRRELMIAVLPCSFTPSLRPLHGIWAAWTGAGGFHILPYTYSMLASKTFETNAPPTLPTSRPVTAGVFMTLCNNGRHDHWRPHPRHA